MQRRLISSPIKESKPVRGPESQVPSVNQTLREVALFKLVKTIEMVKNKLAQLIKNCLTRWLALSPFKILIKRETHRAFICSAIRRLFSNKIVQN